MQRNPSHEPMRRLAEMGALAVLYYAGARLGLLLAIEKTNSTPVWPPAGIALAGMLLFGRRVWPAVWLGAFIANIVVFHEHQAAGAAVILGVSGLIACGNTLEALVGWWLCDRWLASGGEPALGVRNEMLFGKMNVFQFAGVALAASLASAAVGPVVVCAAHVAPWQRWPIIGFTWWAGDATGILYGTPFLLGLARPKWPRWLPLHWGEAAAAFTVLTLTCWIVFFGSRLGAHAEALKFVAIAPLVWIALRFGLRGTVTGLVLLALFAVLSARRKIGTSLDYPEIDLLMLLLAFLWVAAVTILTLARSIAIQWQVRTSLRETNASLEAMMSAIPALVLVANDRECRNITGNQHAYELLQVPPGRNLSKSAPDRERPTEFDVRVDGERIPVEELAMHKAAATGRAVIGQELELILSNGDVRFIYGNAVPLLGEDGTSRGCIAVFVDVTERKRARETVLAKQAELELITSITPVMLARCSRDLRYLFVNRVYAERFGLAPGQIVGRSIPEIMGEEAYQTIRPYVGAVLEGRPVEYEAVVPYKSIGPRVVRVANVPDKDPDGSVVGWVSSIFDITEHRRLEERFRLAVEAAPSGMVLADERGRIVLVNAHAEELFGFTREELIGQQVEILVPERFRKQHPGLRQHYADQPSARPMGAGRDLFALRKDGSEVPVEIGLSPISMEEGMMVLSSIVDITERKRAEAELVAARQRLASDLAAMNRLHGISSRFMRGGDLMPVLEEILDAAMVITGADMGNIQLLDETSQTLRIAVQRGFEKPFLEFFEKVSAGDGASCGAALKQKKRVFVPDVAGSPVFAGTPALPVMIEAGVRAVQSTPLFDRTGGFVGMLSTHFREKRQPDEHALRMVDLLARQTADIIDRNRAEEALRRLNEELEQRVLTRTMALRQSNEDLKRESAERLRLEKEILEIAEKEQRRFGQELHERLGQELAGIWFLSKVLADKLEGECHPQGPASAEMSRMLQAALDSIRDLARSSYPVELETGGLLGALEGLASRTEGLLNVRCVLRCDWPRMFSLPPDLGIHIYRIVQEAVTNAIKHGSPRHVLIECKSGPGRRVITVTDDGEGFSPRPDSAGMGLHLMRYRAELIGAKLDVCRGPDRGCVVTCTILAQK